MNTPTKILASVALAGAIASGGVVLLAKPDPVVLTPVTLNATAVYFAVFADATSTLKVSLTAKQYTDLAKPGAGPLVRPGYKFVTAYKGQLYSTGRDHIEKGEYRDLGNGESEVYLPDGKEAKDVASTFIQANTLSGDGVDLVQKAK